MFQDGNLGLDDHSHLLFHAGPRRWARVHWTGGAHAIFGLRFIYPSGIIPDPRLLWVAEAEEELLTEAHFK